MTTISVEGHGWTAIGFVSEQPDGIITVECRTKGDSQAEALFGATYVLNMFAKGRFAFIRVKPEVDSYKDFDTKITHHKGYVRFHYKLEPGEWHYTDEITKIPSLGEA